jgi:hypothetical protein
MWKYSSQGIAYLTSQLVYRERKTLEIIALKWPLCSKNGWHSFKTWNIKLKESFTLKIEASGLWITTL